MKNILLFVVFLFSILLTVYLYNQRQQKKAANNQENSTKVDSSATNVPSTRTLDKGEFAKLMELEKYADSVTWQLIPTGNMEMSPGFYDGEKYFATEFRGAYPSGTPLFAVHNLRTSDNPDYFQTTLILKNGKVTQVERQYDIGKGMFSIGRRFDFYDADGNNIGTKTLEISPNETENTLDTLINYFQVESGEDLTVDNPNELMQDILNAAYGRGDYALTFEGIKEDSTGLYVQTSTFDDRWKADFLVENQDETFQRLKGNPDKFVGKIIKIEKGFGYDFSKKGRRNHYNGGTIIE